MNFNNLLDFSKKFAYKHFDLILLAGIIYFAIMMRMATTNTDILLDYDPWWFFRHAQEIVNNGMVPLKWDILSFYPPGRPVDYQLGWSYTIALAYTITKIFIPITLMKFAAIFVAVFSGLAAIPAYLTGRLVTNRWGGLVTALFATITPTFLTVSMGGYPDSDTVDVFYTFLAVLTTLYALKKINLLHFDNFNSFTKSLIKFLPHVIPSVVAYWLFAMNWNTSWYIFYIFIAFIPLLVAFRFLESLIQRNTSVFSEKVKELKGVVAAIAMIGIIGGALTTATNQWPFNTIPPLNQLFTGFSFLEGGGLIVNISVAELQTINVLDSSGPILQTILLIVGSFAAVLIKILSKKEINWGIVLSIIVILSALWFTSRDQFSGVVARIGFLPVFLALAGLPSITIMKLFYKEKISNTEYFAIIWLIISLWLITRGVRFSLLFSLAVAAASGFAVGHLMDFFNKKFGGLKFERKNEDVSRHYIMILAAAIIFGSIIYGVLTHLSYSWQLSSSMGGMEVSANWRQALDWLKANSDQNTLIATWWDPGHIIAGYSGLKVHADGAHCGIESCIPYNHNVRIQDMGKMFSTSSETEAYNTLKKYAELSQQDCDKAKQAFPGMMPSNACDPIKTVYFIASSDLIGKYTWLNYFGGYTAKPSSPGSCYVKSTDTWINCFWQVGVTMDNGVPRIERDQNGNPAVIYYGDNGIFALAGQNNQLVAVYGNQYIVKNIVYPQGDQMKSAQYGNVTNSLDGLVWVDQNYGSIIYMNPAVLDSMFTRMFFFSGQGLEKFELAFQNQELKIFKVTF